MEERDMSENKTNGNGAGTAVAERRAPLVSGGAVSAIVPADIEQAYRLAKIIANANMAPKAYERDHDKIMVAMLHGMELGLTPMASLQSIAVVNGMPTLWGDGALGLVRSSGQLEDISERIDGDDGDAPVAVCTVKRKGQATPVVRTFSRADAQKAALWGKAGPWQNYPKRMLQMRARSWALRDAFADVLRGLHIREDLDDSPQTLEQGSDGVYKPPAVARPTRAQFGQASLAEGGEPEPVQQEAPAEPEADPWLISPDTFPTLGKFSDEWRRQLDEACAEPGDVDALVAANTTRLEAFSSDRSTRAAVGALQADADSRRAALAA